jgi:hypothetical protein
MQVLQEAEEIRDRGRTEVSTQEHPTFLRRQGGYMKLIASLI